jgi:hypothetical protein
LKRNCINLQRQRVQEVRGLRPFAFLNSKMKKTYTQHFIDGKIVFGKETAKMVLGKIDAKGGKAHQLFLDDLDLSSNELRAIQKDITQFYNPVRGGFGQKGK